MLITNKASNILQDIETLHLLARIVSDQCRSAEQKEISRKAFELLGAFDEVVSLGYREQLNLTQVRNVLEMESHEEKIQDIIARVRLCRFSITSRPKWEFSYRIRKPKLRKSLNVGLSSLRCSVASSKGEHKAEARLLHSCPQVRGTLAPTHPFPGTRLLLP